MLLLIYNDETSIFYLFFCLNCSNTLNNDIKRVFVFLKRHSTDPLLFLLSSALLSYRIRLTKFI